MKREAIRQKKQRTWRGEDTPRLLTIKQASRYLGATVWCLRSLIWKGDLPVVRLSPRKQLLHKADLDGLIERFKSLDSARPWQKK